MAKSLDPNRTPDRIADRTAVRTPTNERTNGLTEKSDQSPIVSLSGTCAGGAEAFDVITLGQAFAGTFQEGIYDRHPIIRKGERAPIEPHKRAAIWYRDLGICQRCKEKPHAAWHLDHILPWSAGGSDSSTNLRLLCERCNLDRSNFRDGETRPTRGVTWWCQRCYVLDEHFWDYLPDGLPYTCPVHQYGRCRVLRATMRQKQAGTFVSWHERPAIEGFTDTAYCAHCNAPGLTDVVL